MKREEAGNEVVSACGYSVLPKCRESCPTIFVCLLQFVASEYLHNIFLLDVAVSQPIKDYN